jgi:hypothetical protein
MIRVSSRYAAGALAVAGLALAPLSAQATEGPPAAPPPSSLAPFPTASPLLASPQMRSRVLRAKFAQRQVHRGRASRLRLSVSAPGRVQVVLDRHAGKHVVRVTTLTFPARARALTVTIPARLHGKPLAAGSYRVTVVAISQAGERSTPVHRALTVVAH